VLNDPLCEPPFSPDIPELGTLVIEYSARIEGHADRCVLVREELGPAELEQGIVDRAGLGGGDGVMRNALAAFLASRGYRLAGRFFSRVADVVVGKREAA